MPARISRFLLLLLVIALLPSPFVATAQGGSNLLNNPGFEGHYQSYRYGNGELVLEFRIADGWHPWYRAHTAGDPSWAYRRPEYRPASYSYNGTMAQQFFASFGMHEAGLWQRVETAVPDQAYRFSIAAYVWSSSEDDPFRSVDPGLATVRVGIDPTGGINPYMDTVVWSPLATFYDEWQVLAVEAVAQSNAITVFFWSSQEYGVEHNDVAVDEAVLMPVDAVTLPSADVVAAAEVEAPPVAEEAVAPTAEAPAPSPTGVVLYGDVNLKLRERPYAAVIGVIPAGVPVSVLGRSDDRNWAMVSYEGQVGWVGSWLATYSSPFDDLPVIPLS